VDCETVTGVWSWTSPSVIPGGVNAEAGFSSAPARLRETESSRSDHQFSGVRGPSTRTGDVEVTVLPRPSAP
jgi:hypothetical protein